LHFLSILPCSCSFENRYSLQSGGGNYADDRQFYEDPDSRLYDLIFRPLKDALSLSQVNNLIFSTDSLFRTIPLAALYDKETSKFLVEDFSSSVTPSFQVIEKDRYKSLKSANVITGLWTNLKSQRD
jgi:CHAT domain-containing protein